MKHLISISVLAATFFIIGANAQKRNLPELKTVPSVDLARYSGNWYEIARYPNKFQRRCVGNTTATYTLKKEGKIEVLNKCLKRDGTVDSAKGEAKVTDKTTNAKLKVRFAPAALSFLPVVWGDYWVIDLGPEYDYVAIGEPKREYFWILSRRPSMDDSLFQAVLRRAEAMGFEPGRVERTPQNVEPLKGAVIERPEGK
jgi:apolipoprotein D and lipocalin family protein